MPPEHDDDNLEPPPRPVSGLIWAALAVLVVLGFIVAMRMMNPVGPGVGG